ncbi:Hypothetical protein, putative [Bodo saltans]|uniref:Uncharacterized protein n=1 Tax=Bodo saltans TaxID=75058 RepID=A0A0S4KL97_BODSA|nr:Hypothetical protein, putative [Bodo saltans]|eukprot:CUI15388.1 Hypothetical protein, putative [Bodo saltans]
MSPFRLLLHRGEEEDNHHHRDFSRDRLGDSTTSAMIDGQTPTVSPQLLAGSERGDENPFAVPPLRTSAISRSSSSVLSMPPETPTMEAVFVEEVRVASHAFGLLDGAEDDALFSEVSSPQGSLTGESFVGGNGRGTGGSRSVAAQRKLFFPLSSTMLQPLISSVDAAAASSSSEGASYPPIPAHHLLPSASVGMLHPRLLDNVVYYLWHTALTYPQHPLRKALTWFVEQRLDYLTSAMRVAGIRVADVQWDSAVANPFDVSDLIGQSLAVSSRPSSTVNRQTTTTTSAAAPNDRQEIHRFYSFPNGAKGMWETDRVAFVAALSETFAEKMFVARSIPVTMDLPDPWSNLSPLSTSYSVAAACAAVLVEERDRALILLKGSTNSISYSLTSRLTLTNDKNATSSSGGDKARLEDAGKAVAALRSSIASKFTSLKSTLRRARSNSSLLSESKPSLTTSGSTTVNSARTYQDFVLVRPSGAAVVNHRSRSPSPTDPDGNGDLDEIDDDDLCMNPGGPRAGGGALSIHSLESSTRASVTSATATTTTLLENDVILPGSNKLGASPLGGCVLCVSIGPVFRETVPASLDGLLYWLILDAVLCLHFGSRQVRDDVLLAAASTAIDAKNADDRALMYKFRNGVRIYALLDDVISTAESHQPTTTTPVGAEPVVKTLCVTDAGLAMLTGLALELDRFVEAWITRVLSYASPSQPSTGVKPPFATAATTTDRGGLEPPNWVNPDSETERLISFLQHTFQIVEHVATYSTIEFRFRRSLPPSSSALIDGESSKGKEDEVERQLSGPLHSDDEMERQMQHQNRSHDAVGADVLLPVAVCLCSRLKWKHVLLPVMQWIDARCSRRRCPSSCCGMSLFETQVEARAASRHAVDRWHTMVRFPGWRQRCICVHIHDVHGGPFCCNFRIE